MASDDSCKSVSRFALHFLTGTFISRVSGMLRDISMAFCFGASSAVASFLVAFRLANLLRRLFGEGALLNGFIPFFEKIRKQSPEEAARFFRDLFFSLAIFLTLIVVGLEAVCISILGSNLLSADAKEVLYLTMLMLPGILFICLFGLTSALLECERNFFIPGVAPVAFNLVWIAAIWAFYQFSAYSAMIAISCAIVAAFFLQCLVTIPAVLRYLKKHLDTSEWMRPNLFAPELKTMISPLLLGVVGVAAVQVNSAVDVIIARFASLSGPAYLSYAHRLQQLPLALFGIAIASALMPALSRSVKNDDSESYHRLMSFALSRTWSFLMPTTMAIFVLGAASVNLIYGHGNFDPHATLQTTLCLWGYGIGLIPAAFVLLLAPSFYAREDFWTPTKASIYAVICNTVLNTIFVFGLSLGPLSIALATSFSSLFNLLYLLKEERVFSIKPLLPSFIRLLGAALFAALLVLGIDVFVCQDPTFWIMLNKESTTFCRLFSEQIRQFILLTSTFGISFLLFCYLLKAEAVLDLFRFFRQEEA
ncbi:MAG: murein biosynthesis integral membrane protein MurJ [Chlamydiae bacterium]|nr:murein biosynthesis integral membrane protein MurJ [Chlamydiota bacterium]